MIDRSGLVVSMCSTVIPDERGIESVGEDAIKTSDKLGVCEKDPASELGGPSMDVGPVGGCFGIK